MKNFFVFNIQDVPFLGVLVIEGVVFFCVDFLIEFASSILAYNKIVGKDYDFWVIFYIIIKL